MINVLIAETIECCDSKLSDVLFKLCDKFNIQDIILDSHKIKNNYDEINNIIKYTDIIFFVIDIKIAMTTNDEFRSLHFLLDSVNDNKNNGKMTDLFIIIDRCGNSFDNDIIKIKCNGEKIIFPNQILLNNYNKICNVVQIACKSKNINSDNINENIVIISLLITNYVNTYFSIVNDESDIDANILNIFGEFYVGHKKWRCIKNVAKKRELLKPIINDDIINNAGYYKFDQIINAIVDKHIINNNNTLLETNCNNLNSVFDLLNMFKYILYGFFIFCIMCMCYSRFY